MRRSLIFCATPLQGLGFGKKSNFFTSLWSKPETRDERVKEYVPEVIEESLEEQRAVLAESTSRDVIVELGHKILLDVENKSPTPNIAPNLNKIMLEYGAKDVIAQRPLSYLLYPNSSALDNGEQAHDLIASFPDNFRSLIEEVERNGCSMKTSPRTPVGGAGEGENTTNGDHAADRRESEAGDAENRSGPVIMASTAEHEPLDVTMFVKIASAMALANVHCGDLRNAVRCADVGIANVVDQQRLGGLLGMKAGLLVRQKKYEEAAETAELAMEASGNIQGYLHGAYALRMLKRSEEAVALLERGREDHPMNTTIASQLEAAQKEVKLSLPEGSEAERLSE